jgi:maleylpyruvate isomerase
VVRLYRIPFSTNVERVALALAHKQIPTESIHVDPEDRTVVREVSGQDLVPVIEEEGRIVADSTRILEYVEERYPEPSLYPGNPARRAEMKVFIDWFNRVWKVPPNEIDAELDKAEPDRERIGALGNEMRESLDRFEEMLAGRGYLFGDFSAADCAAFPFLKYALLRVEDGDDEVFHHVLAEHLPLGDDHGRVAEWIQRVDALPRV